MKLAQRAKDQLLKERALGEKAFDDLLAKFPSDGMVYFKRGEAWDRAEQFGLALCDYKRAANLFRMEAWRKRAEAAAERVGELIANMGPPRRNVEGASEINPKFDQIYRDALAKIESEPRSALVFCRTAAELAANHMLDSHREKCDKSAGFAEKINRLRTLELITPAGVCHMHTCRVLGNEAAHGGPISKEDADVSLRALNAIVHAAIS